MKNEELFRRLTAAHTHLSKAVASCDEVYFSHDLKKGDFGAIRADLISEQSRLAECIAKELAAELSTPNKRVPEA